ncbi:tetratricopeptide repeat protein [Sphingomonas sp.]|uniref:tetratricopeptide repeat protein n=1 Tax=Sphingomonas sp. TaxID=28214 RepID=UPI002CF77489|nr:tetratricopeptide repeat protein [Sphingomonas sp.]HTG38194.1 tetratricopeptide repeat protein [Sphingomonas sp.]
MISNPERAPRRRSLRRRWQRRIVIAAIALVALAVLALGLRGLLPERADRPAAERALAVALGRLKAGNPSAARVAAGDAVAADPGWGLAHAVLARAQLALDDGLGAGASLDRARAVGFDMDRVHQLRARAELLMGRADAARAELNAARPDYAAYTDLVRGELAMIGGDHRAAAEILGRAVAARPADGAAWSLLARARRAAGDVASAIAASERAVAVAPQSTDALTLRGELVRDQYGLVASLPWFGRALQRDPQNHQALIEYAATLGDIGRTRDMLAVLRRATQVRAGSTQALYLQAVLAARAQRFDLARSILDRAGGALDALPGAVMLKAILDLEDGELEQAIRRLRTLVDRQPTSITARKLLAGAYARSDASRNAIGILAPVVERADADGYSLTLAARAFERVGERAVAARLLDRASLPTRSAAAAFSPDNSVTMLRARAQQAGGSPTPRIALIRGLIAAGDNVLAAAEARSLVAAHPGVPAAHRVAGDVAMLTRRPGDAVQAYGRAAALRFDQSAVLRMVEAQAAAGRRDEAARTLALFLSQNPQNVAALRLSAQWQLAAGQFEAAAATLEGLRFRLGNRDAALLAQLAVAHLAIDNDALAAEYAAAAYALQPQNPGVADAYRAALLAMGDVAGSRDLERKVAALRSTSAPAAAY